jgi:hypothetical protein
VLLKSIHLTRFRVTLVDATPSRRQTYEIKRESTSGGLRRRGSGENLPARLKAMKKADLARRLAKRSGVSPAEAADQLDRVVNEIITNLRKGQTVLLPGLGTFTAGRSLRFKFEGGSLEPKIARRGYDK